MTKRRGTLGVIVIWCLALWGALPISVAANGPISHWAMNGAGSALPGQGSTGLSNPALVALMSERSFHMVMRLSENTDGIEQLFAYAEPDNGFAAGVLTWNKARWSTGVDQVTGAPLYDEFDNWAYVVASSFDAGMMAGVTINYHSVKSDSRMDQGQGYRLDMGMTRPVDNGLWVGLHVEGLAGGIWWSNGERTTSPRILTAGVAWLLNDSLRVALDLVSDPKEGPAGVRVGGATRLGPVQLLAGVKTRAGSTHWSAGVSYESGPTSLEYAYVEETAVHMAGLTWRF